MSDHISDLTKKIEGAQLNMHLTKTEERNLIYIQRYEKLEWFCEVKTMAKGESFGELALTKDEPRAAAIQCETKCYFAVIQKANYNKLIKKMHYKNEQQHIEFFCKLPYFMHWTNNQLKKLVLSSNIQLFQRS